MILLNQLICQSNFLLEIVDELLKVIRKALEKEYVFEIEADILNEMITITLNAFKSFIKNYNQFLNLQFEIDIE